MSDERPAVRVGDMATLVRGVTYTKQDSSDRPAPGLVPLLRATNINSDLDFTGLVYVPESCVSGGQYVQSGDTIIAASSGSLSVVGKSAQLRQKWHGTFGAFCYSLRPAPTRIAPFYLGYFLQTSEYRSQVSRLAAGVNINNLKRQHLEELKIPLFPVAEQHRIVDAIESYFTRLDDAVATLERVQRNLTRYRASVLKAAVEGRLVPTEAELASAEGRDYEPASVLLERILVERRRRWEEAELAKMAAKGKTPKDDKWKGRYKEPVRPSVASLPRVPDGWAWATVDMVADIKGGITKGQKLRPGEEVREVPYLRVANVQRGFLDLSIMKTISATDAQIDELRLAPGDVLFNEGGDRDKLGRGWLWKGEIPECIHQNHVFRARILTSDLVPEFLSWFGNTSGQVYFFDEGKQTTNLASINMTKLRALPVPLPPRPEQDRIREATERHLSVADTADRLLSNDLRRCARLRQAVLKWAFEGKLVDQDSADEPASVLLDRIKTGRDDAASETKSTKRGRRKARSARA